MAAVDQFNAASPSARLPTRIGISAARFPPRRTGAVNHYEFRPVGDTVVTATRLQELNKRLGTRILAAEACCPRTRYAAGARPGGISAAREDRADNVFEIVDERESASAHVMQLCLEFALALDALRGGRRENALERFRAIHERYPQDGPTAFYVQWLSSNPLASRGVIPQ